MNLVHRLPTGGTPATTRIGHSPLIGTIIQIPDCPPVGGNTSWASARKAYRCLSEPMKGYLDGLIAVHYWDGRARARIRPPTPHLHGPPQPEATSDEQTDSKAMQQNSPHRHPVVATHPITGEKTLYVNETYTIFIEGLHQYESRAVLNFLYSWIRMPEFYVTHNWAANDIGFGTRMPYAALRTSEIMRATPGRPASDLRRRRRAPLDEADRPLKDVEDRDEL